MKRPGWDSTFVNHCKREWRYRQQKTPVSQSGGDLGALSDLTPPYPHPTADGLHHETGIRLSPRTLCPAERVQLAEQRYLRRFERERADAARPLDGR